MKTEVYDPYSKKMLIEVVPAQSILSWLYHTKLGLLFRPIIVSKSFSKLYGFFKNSRDQNKILKFADKTGISLEEFEGSGKNQSFKDYNDFFIRKFRSGKRNLSEKTEYFAAPCEARYLIKEKIDITEPIRIKHHAITLEELTGNKLELDSFEEGQLIIARLAPQDYHRFHFPAKGRVVEQFNLNGRLDTVTDYGIVHNSHVLMQNKRSVSVLEFEKFGRAIFVEIGALSVGRIIQTHQGEQFEALAEKGYFKIGGSSVVLILENKGLSFREELQNYSKQNIETFIRVGDRLGDL